MIARGERARSIARQGLVVTGLANVEARPAVIDDPKELVEADTLVVATKAIGTPATLASVGHVRFRTAFSVQNGVLKNELLARVFGSSSVLGAMADFSGELTPSGEVKFTRNVRLYLGDENDGMTPRAEDLARLVDAAGVRSEAVADIRTREWSKFAGWMPLFLLAALTRQITWKFLMDAQTAVVVVRMAREAAALAAALRIELVDASPLPVPRIVRASDEAAIDIVRGVGKTFLEKSPEHRMSSQQDVLRGSRLEYVETLGHALDLGREVGVPMPTLDDGYRILSVAHPE
jgi:2-dehydropantoate 2-reductase